MINIKTVKNKDNPNLYDLYAETLPDTTKEIPQMSITEMIVYEEKKLEEIKYELSGFNGLNDYNSPRLIELKEDLAFTLDAIIYLKQKAESRRMRKVIEYCEDRLSGKTTPNRLTKEQLLSAKLDKEDIKYLILNNLTNGIDIDLSDLNFKGYTVHLGDMEAMEIHNVNQVASSIFNYGQDADRICNDKQTADIITNDEQEAGNYISNYNQCKESR